MKKFSINCDFGGQMSPFTIYIGVAKDDHHPLHFQADWLTKQRGGTIPTEVMEAITKLQELANKNNVLLEELCVYALGSAQEDASKPQEEPKELEESSELEEIKKTDESSEPVSET